MRLEIMLQVPSWLKERDEPVEKVYSGSKYPTPTPGQIIVLCS